MKFQSSINFFQKKIPKKNFTNDFPIFLKNRDNRRSILATHDSRTPLSVAQGKHELQLI